MKTKAVSGIMLTLLLIGMLTLAFNIQPAKASGTIYISSDYTFTSNIYEPIVVTADNIIIDGAGYTVQGNGSGTGIDLSYRNNVTLKNVEVTNFTYGIYLNYSSNNNLTCNNASNNEYGIGLLDYSSNNNLTCNNASNNIYGIYVGDSSNNNIAGNTVSNNTRGIELSFSDNNVLTGNTASNNGHGILLSFSDNNVLTGNTASNNGHGILLSFSSNNILTGNTASYNSCGIYGGGWSHTLFHNNLINNTNQACPGIHTWDDGYPSGGNYWSDYTGADVKSGANQDQPSSDGIGDTPYIINQANIDHYPLMYPWSAPSPPSYNFTIYSSPTGVTFTVDGVSRSTPWSGTYTEDASVSLVMPETYDGYIWFHWLEDGDPNRTKTVTMDTNTTLTAVFTPDTTSPTISIVSPENKTYPVEDVPLTFTVSESTSWMGYSLDGQANVTITGNRTLSGLLDGSHYVVVYANDTAGNMGASSTVYFAVDTVPPNIIDVSQTPLEDNVLPEDEVRVNATVTDYVSGVKQVSLNYTNGYGTWISVNMTNLVGNIWNATIPAFPYGTNVTYRIIAEDNMNNTITTEDLGYDYQYTVIPEFPTWTPMLLILILLSIAIAIYKRRLLKTPIH